jgi:hypothetical protein
MSLGKFLDGSSSIALSYLTYICYILHFGPYGKIYLHSIIYTNTPPQDGANTS